MLATLREEERAEARRILLALVTAADGLGVAPTGTRTRRTAEDLVGPQAAPAAPARAALEALVRGRLVVAGETYEIAHEALARAWPRLRAWLDEASEARAVASRLAGAAREWARLGRGDEGLGTERLLRELTMPERSTTRARRRSNSSRRVAPLCAVRGSRHEPSLSPSRPSWFFLVAPDGSSRPRAIAQPSRAPSPTRASSTRRPRRAHARRRRCATRPSRCSRRTTSARRRTPGSGCARSRKTSIASVATSAPHSTSALALEPRDPRRADLYADVTLARFLAAERLHDEISSESCALRLDVYDDGSRAAQLRAPAHVRVETEPPGATLTLARYREDAARSSIESDRTPLTAGDRRELEPGSYLIVAEAPGRYTTRYPFRRSSRRREPVADRPPPARPTSRRG